MFHVDLSSILGLVAVAMCWALSVVLFRVGSPSSVARKLAVLLVVEGFTLVTNVIYLFLVAQSIDAGWTLDERVLPALFFVHTLCDCLMLALYPTFLATALNTKLTRPFAGKRMRMLVRAVSVILFIAAQFSKVGIAEVLLYAALSLLFTYAMVASIHAWLVAPPGIVRDRARSFALAFSIRDICWGFVYGISIWHIIVGSYLMTDQLFLYWVDLIYRLGTLIYVPIIAYGILRTRLFDIDLRIRWTIKQSTLAAIIVAIMFVISEGTERLLSTGMGNVASFLVAAIVVFLLTPVQRFAERVAIAAMPNTQNTPEYIEKRKKLVYESALTEAQSEDGISDRERALLIHLRDSLGISAADADAIELDLQARVVS